MKCCVPKNISGWADGGNSWMPATFTTWLSCELVQVLWSCTWSPSTLPWIFSCCRFCWCCLAWAWFERFCPAINWSRISQCCTHKKQITCPASWKIEVSTTWIKKGRLRAAMHRKNHSWIVEAAYGTKSLQSWPDKYWTVWIGRKWIYAECRDIHNPELHCTGSLAPIHPCTPKASPFGICEIRVCYTSGSSIAMFSEAWSPSRIHSVQKPVGIG